MAKLHYNQIGNQSRLGIEPPSMAPQQDPVEHVVHQLRYDRRSNSDGLQRGTAGGRFVAERVVPFFT